MGIDTRVFTVYGVRHKTDDYKEFFHRYNELVDPSSDDAKVWIPEELPSIIWEGLDYKSFVLGTVLFRTSSFRWDFTAGDISVSIGLWQLEHYEDAYKQQFREHFPDFVELVNRPFKILSFINFS